MSTLIAKLGIEWKILIAQVVNFGILFFVLRHFLYKPILKMLDKRRKELLKDKEARALLVEKINGLEKTREEMLQKTRKESAEIIKAAETAAAKMRDGMIEETKREAERARLAAKRAVEEERQTAMREVKGEIGALVADAISKSLGDILDEKTEEKLAAEAISKINSVQP